MIARFGVLVCVVASTACASSGATRIATGSVSRWTGSFRPAASGSSAVLAPVTPNRGAGSIIINALGGAPARMRVDLSVSGAPPSTQVAWAVFSGPCGSTAPMLAGQNEFPPISVSSSGDGHIQTDMAFALDPRAAYHANVYSTSRANDMNDVMMCANLKPEG